MEDSGYAIGRNVFLNVNTSRYDFYKRILEYSNKNDVISYVELLRLGYKVPMSTKYIDSEIIGCLYANFLVPEFTNNIKNGTFRITERAKRDFSVYHNDAKTKTNEITLTIIFREKDIKAVFFTMDTVSEKNILALKDFGWTHNKSQFTCMRRCKNLDKLRSNIELLVSTFDPDLYEYSESFSDVIKKYGHRRKIYKDYAANLSHRGVFACKTFFKYKEIYVQLKRLTRNPVDWGGDIFHKNLVETICKDYDINIEVDKFLIEAMKDGMIRTVNGTSYSITGHAASIINSIVDLSYKRRIPVIIRKYNEKYCLLIGYNTSYDKVFISELKSKGFKLKDYWFWSELQPNKDAVVDLLNKMIKAFYDINKVMYHQLSLWLD
ncbi:hypothetical protein [Clostridium akagii]|uniref:hypothetical protein n=1 Tax=Clostridium akagii TaxID=91623 RepID=UPI00047BCF80|nr:hypothetical protein [Clostridium akagii]